MMDRSHAGIRCRTRRHVSTAEGMLPRHSHGTIRYELDNLDRRLVFIDWDNGMTVLVFPHEIEVLEEERLGDSRGRGQECLVEPDFAPLDDRTAA